MAEIKQSKLVKGYNVQFKKYNEGWKWVLYYGKKIMAKSEVFYSTERSATRIFWRIFSNPVINQVEDNYTGTY